MAEANQKNLFTGAVTDLVGMDIEAPLPNAQGPVCEYFVSAYADAAQKADADGMSKEAAAYRFLHAVTSFFPKFDTSEEPFGPLAQFNGRRMPIPGDLTPFDITALETIARGVIHPSLRARIFDVLWLRKKDFKCGMEAAEAYIAAAKSLDTTEHWTFAVTHFRRALMLAGKFGRNKPLFEKASHAIAEAARNASKGQENYRCCQLMCVMQKHSTGDPVEFAAIAEKLAHDAAGRSLRDVAKAYWEVAADWHDAAKNTESACVARIAAAEMDVAEAEARTSGKLESYLAASSILARAIEALRQAGGNKQRIAELRARLLVYQEKSLNEMRPISLKNDISSIVEEAMKAVRGLSFVDAISKFVLGISLSTLKDIKEKVREVAKDYPIQYLMGGVIIDERGRKIEHKEGLHGLSGEKLEEALAAEAFHYASQNIWSFRVAAFIIPARDQIFNDHHPSFDDLEFLVRNNPFVPPGHEMIFLRGIYAGFHNDFVLASHFLVPQIENSIRHILQIQGVDVSNLMSDGTQPVKILGALLSMPETIKTFGEDLVFELRGNLIEKTGTDFRNRVAHGFVSEGECYTPAPITLWWLVVRICFTVWRNFSSKQQS